MSTRVADLAPAAKVELLDLESMPYDRRAHLAAIRDLSTRDYGALMKLREHIWQWGCLPQEPVALAKIAGIGVLSFQRAAPKLARHFDSDCSGAWTDDFLIRARGTSPVVPLPKAPAVDPGLSAIRSAAGAAGGRASVESRRQLAASRQAPGSDGSKPDGLLQSEAKFQANEPSKDSGVASDLVTPVRGWLVLEDDNDLSKANQPTACAAEATGQAKPDIRDDQVATAKELDQRMIEAILVACPGKIKRGPASWGLKAVREWIAEGCSFELDFLPTLKDFAETNKTVKHIANPLIRESTFQARDARLAGASSASPATVFVVEGSPEWRAWLRFKGKTSHATRPSRRDRTKSGWDFTSAWPEGWDDARLAKVEAESTRHDVLATGSS